MHKPKEYQKILLFIPAMSLVARVIFVKKNARVIPSRIAFTMLNLQKLSPPPLIFWVEIFNLSVGNA